MKKKELKELKTILNDTKEVRDNILTGIELNDKILTKFGINDLDTIIYNLHKFINGKKQVM